MNSQRSVRNLGIACIIVFSLCGCAVTGPPAPPPLLPGPATSGAPTVVAVAVPTPPPLTLPQYLGIDALGRGVLGGARHLRLKLATRWPALQPTATNPPRAIGDPANLQSPSPAVATAAAAQLAAADAPAKAAALAYLATLGCSSQPATEEALLAGLDDVSHDVRAAAAQAVANSQKNPGSLGCQCNCSCSGCCTPAIRAKLTHMAYAQDRPGCYCEPSPKVRRLCRLALAACGGPGVESFTEPEELPPPASIQAIQVSATIDK